MTLDEPQRERIRAKLARIAPHLAAAAPPERRKLIREALERAGVTLTWEEWQALAPEFLDEALLAYPGVAGR